MIAVRVSQNSSRLILPSVESPRIVILPDRPAARHASLCDPLSIPPLFRGGDCGPLGPCAIALPRAERHEAYSNSQDHNRKIGAEHAAAWSLRGASSTVAAHCTGADAGASPHCTRGMSVSSWSDPLFIASRLLMNTSGYIPVGGVRIPMKRATSAMNEMQL